MTSVSEIVSQNVSENGLINQNDKVEHSNLNHEVKLDIQTSMESNKADSESDTQSKDNYRKIYYHPLEETTDLTKIVKKMETTLKELKKKINMLTNDTKYQKSFKAYDSDVSHKRKHYSRSTRKFKKNKRRSPRNNSYNRYNYYKDGGERNYFRQYQTMSMSDIKERYSRFHAVIHAFSKIMDKLNEDIYGTY